jgi:redox-sensitive bicupin YhaK (pirin superfamily)
MSNQTDRSGSTSTRLGRPASAKSHTIGGGFAARQFFEDMFGGQMDPLIMVDHFVMTEPTFEPHLHAGSFAVTAMFEDSEGEFLNRHTLGQSIVLNAGDLYWLAAASGAVHEERPGSGARTHALQILVNLPSRLKRESARSLLVRAEDIPVLLGNGYCVRVMLGTSGEVQGAKGTPEEMTMLDGYLDAGAHFFHLLPDNRQMWIYTVSGTLQIHLLDDLEILEEGAALAVEAGERAEISIEAAEPSHFVIMAASPIREPFVKYGPLVMSTTADLHRALADYEAGRFGRLAT